MKRKVLIVLAAVILLAAGFGAGFATASKMTVQNHTATQEALPLTSNQTPLDVAALKSKHYQALSGTWRSWSGETLKIDGAKKRIQLLTKDASRTYQILGFSSVGKGKQCALSLILDGSGKSASSELPQLYVAFAGRAYSTDVADQTDKTRNRLILRRTSTRCSPTGWWIATLPRFRTVPGSARCCRAPIPASIITCQR